VLLTANFIDKTDVRPHAAFLLDATGAWHVFARVVRLNKQTNSKILTMLCRRTAGLNLIKTLGRGNPVEIQAVEIQGSLLKLFYQSSRSRFLAWKFS